MSNITYWKCPHCHGVGKRIAYPGQVETCLSCDGTGNGLVDGEERRLRRVIKELETQDSKP